MRLFVSIDFEEKLRQELASWVPELCGWKKTRADKIHLTLEFIGDCSQHDLEIINNRLQAIRFPRFTLEIKNLGVFPDSTNPRIIWAGVSPDASLVKLQKQVADLTESFRNRADRRTYIPHITLARRKRSGSVKEVRALIQKPTYPQNAYIQTFNLKQSILKTTGSEHRVIYTYRAADLKRNES